MNRQVTIWYREGKYNHYALGWDYFAAAIPASVTQEQRDAWKNSLWVSYRGFIENGEVKILSRERPSAIASGVNKK
jgi:SH3-like domain-containing protein